MAHPFEIDRCLMAWFDKKSMLRLRIHKMKPSSPKNNENPWLLTRGTKGQHGFGESQFRTLGDLFASLLEHELETLAETQNVPVMVLIAMAADEGEAR